MADLTKHESFPLDNKFPVGWDTSKGEGQKFPSVITVGELSHMLADHFGDRVRFNLVKSRPELDGVEVKGDHLQHLYVVLGELGWKVGKMAALDAWMALAHKHSYSPVVEYLDQLLSNEEVQPVDLDAVAYEYLGAEGQLDGAKVAAMLVGAVNRAYEPGCKFDGCLTLKGAQGIKKSTVFEKLASSAWFIDTHQDKQLDMRLAIHHCWIYEMQELETVTARQLEGKVKALLSSSMDTFKQPYGYGMGDHPRRSIFVASVNRDDFLKDSTGNRRFWVVDLPHRPDLGEQIDVERVARDRDRIWKAAVLAYKAGRKPILTQMEEVQNAADNQEFTQENWCVGALAQWLPELYHRLELGLRKHLPAGHFTIDEALAEVTSRGRTASQPQVADALKELGCIKHPQKMIRGVRLRLWEAPKPAPSEEEVDQIINETRRMWD
jgi:predicted P-loop ATPase